MGYTFTVYPFLFRRYSEKYLTIKYFCEYLLSYFVQPPVHTRSVIGSNPIGAMRWGVSLLMKRGASFFCYILSFVQPSSPQNVVLLGLGRVNDCKELIVDLCGGSRQHTFHAVSVPTKRNIL